MLTQYHEGPRQRLFKSCFGAPPTFLSLSLSLSLLLLLRLRARCLLLLLLLLDGVGLVKTLALLAVLALGVPLAGLEDEDADEDEGEDGVAGGHDLEGVLATEDDLAGEGPVDGLGEAFLVPDAGADGAQAFNNIGNVDADADEVENQGGAVEEHVRLGGLEELDEEAEEAGADGDVQDARDQGRRLVHELEVHLELVEEGRGDGLRGP